MQTGMELIDFEAIKDDNHQYTNPAQCTWEQEDIFSNNPKRVARKLFLVLEMHIQL